LHPLLLRQLVGLFQDPEVNPRQAQLIFTTHDVSLMEAGYEDGAQLSRNEVWLVEKDASGASSLVSLAEFGPRTRDNLARRYLSGRFGGIPHQSALMDPVLV
jgi:AAA15 family ATPase/GTPase